MASELFQYTGKLARFIVRRDRARLPIWIVSILAITLAVAAAFPDLYSSEIERQAIAETMRNPAMTSMLGPAYGIDNYHAGAMMAHQMLLFTALAVAIMSIMLVTRHTRGDEERGRIEMIRSLPVGRLAGLGSTLAVLLVANLVLGLVIGLGLFALGIESMDFNGSLLYGSVLGVTGVFFAATTAFFAQLAETSRGTLGYSFAFLGAMYILRAAGDIGSEWLSLVSPLGLVLRAQVYVNNYWWPVGIALGFAIVVAVVTFYLNAIRDLEAGLIAAKPGRRNARRSLLSPLGLAFRLQRTTIISWAVGMLVLGASYGSVFGDLEAFFDSSDIIQQLLTATAGVTPTEQFTAMVISVLSMISTIPAVMMVLKLKSEEAAHRTEHLLARHVSRYSLLGSYLLVAVVVTMVMQCLTALGLWSAAASVMDEPPALGMMMQAALAYIPAILVMVGLAVFTVGVRPGLASLTWLYLTFSFFVAYLGGLLQLPTWVEKLSPFGHIPQLPLEVMNGAAVAMVLLIALGLTSAGFLGYRRRDIYG